MGKGIEEYGDIKFLESAGLTDEDKTFIRNVMASRSDQFNPKLLPAYQIIAEFYLAKQYEVSSKASDKASRVMTWLTAAIALFTLCQVLIAIFK